MNFDKIPAKLKEKKNWTVRREKIPVIAETPFMGRRAKSNDPNTWSSFEEARNCYLKHKDRSNLSGLSYMLSEEQAIIGIDIDKCRKAKTGEVHPIAKKLIQSLNSYAEVSPSGTGIKIWIEGTIPENCLRSEGKSGFVINAYPEKEMQIEVYRCKRPFTVTTQRLIGMDTVRNGQKALDELCRLYRKRKPDPPPKRAYIPLASEGNADEVISQIQKSRQGVKFNRLFLNGDGSKKQNEKQSQHEADLSLCAIIAWWCPNPNTIDAIFRKSALMRNKWERIKYRNDTINLALNYARP